MEDWEDLEMHEKFNPLDYWGNLAIRLSEENNELRKQVLSMNIAINGFVSQIKRLENLKIIVKNLTAYWI